MNVDIAVGLTLAGSRVERLLGRGAMGALYRFRRRFLLESQLAAALEQGSSALYARGST
jgi:hypothetical protein